MCTLILSEACVVQTLEAIILFMVAGETFIKRINGKEIILLELPSSNIWSIEGETFRLKEEEEIVEVMEEVMI